MEKLVLEKKNELFVVVKFFFFRNKLFHLASILCVPIHDSLIHLD